MTDTLRYILDCIPFVMWPVLIGMFIWMWCRVRRDERDDKAAALAGVMRRLSCNTERRHWADLARCECCGEPLSEWFTDLDQRANRSVMYCYGCDVGPWPALSPWVNHAEYRAAFRRAMEVGDG